VIETRVATEPEMRAWLSDWRARLNSWYGTQPAGPAGWVSAQVEQRVAGFTSAPESVLHALIDGDELIGMLAVSAIEQDGRPGTVVSDIWIAPGHRRRGYGKLALARAEEWARARRGRSVRLVTDPAQPAHAALFAAYPVRALQMIKELSGPGDLADGLEGRPMMAAEYAGWRAETERGYVSDAVQAGDMLPELAAASAAAQTDQLLPDGLSTADHSFLCLCAGEQVVATNWIAHHRAPGMSWVYAVEVHEGFRGKGYGRAAMVIGELAALGAGDTHLALNVFGHNHVAISLYNGMGYRAYDAGRSVDL
jgi:ribosomal protein S18 acetylase RimI-like enzyme